MKNNTIVILLILAFLPVFSTAQKLPQSNLVLFEINTEADKIELAAPRFLTGFNKKGYNNQPYFFSESELYLTAQNQQDTTQSDILALDVFGKLKTQITATPQPEYSPTPMPDRSHFSCIRVDSDGAQMLWAYPLDRSDTGYNLFEWLTNIGYHCWLNAQKAALFLVGTGDKDHQLVIADNSTRKTEYITSNPGRCMAALSDGDFLFVVKATEQTWFIKHYNAATKSSKIVISTRPNSEDFCLLPDGAILMGDGAKIYRYHPSEDTTWQLCGDLSGYGVRKVTRMASNGAGKLVVVVE